MVTVESITQAAKNTGKNLTHKQAGQILARHLKLK
jgi:hypothetical protein